MSSIRESALTVIVTLGVCVALGFSTVSRAEPESLEVPKVAASRTLLAGQHMALAYSVENIAGVQEALPGHPIAILEAGWATTAEEFIDQASEINQARYYRLLDEWALDVDMTVFFFSAFDEPWKGNPASPLGAEKHWGIFFVDRTPKYIMKPRAPDGY